jgi:hypothetical protein
LRHCRRKVPFLAGKLHRGEDRSFGVIWRLACRCPVQSREGPTSMRLAFISMLTAPLFLAAATTVMAESQRLPDRDTCWERIYDDAHLKAHPRQQVVQIRLFHLPSRWPRPAPGVTFVALEMNLRAPPIGAIRSTTASAGSASRVMERCAARRNGAPGVGRSSPKRMDRSLCGTTTSPSIRPRLPRRSGRKML